MRLHILVEGTSEEALLKPWLARMLPGHRILVHPHRGKGHIPGNPDEAPDPRREGLLDQLPAKLRSFGKEMNPDTDRVIVLVDADNDNCEELKNRMVALLDRCRPTAKAAFCVAIEEVEAFYIGDEIAIRPAFPKAKIKKLNEYEPDSIIGAWEFFQKVIGSPIEDKTEWAEKMGKHLAASPADISRTTSPSFKYFCTVLFREAGESELNS
jgi:hypothetical protein